MWWPRLGAVSYTHLDVYKRQVLQIQEETEQRREEIFRLDQLLSHYGIRFSELVKISPKHQDARERALQVARTLISDLSLIHIFFHLLGHDHQTDEEQREMRAWEERVLRELGLGRD